MKIYIVKGNSVVFQLIVHKILNEFKNIYILEHFFIRKMILRKIQIQILNFCCLLINYSL